MYFVMFIETVWQGSGGAAIKGESGPGDGQGVSRQVSRPLSILLRNPIALIA